MDYNKMPRVGPMLGGAYQIGKCAWMGCGMCEDAQDDWGMLQWSLRGKTYMCPKLLSFSLYKPWLGGELYTLFSFLFFGGIS